MLMHAPAARIGLIRPRQPQLACRHACPSIRPADGSITSRPRTAAQVDDRGRRPSRGPRMLHALHCTPLISQRNVTLRTISSGIPFPCTVSPAAHQPQHCHTMPTAKPLPDATHASACRTCCSWFRFAHALPSGLSGHDGALHTQKQKACRPLQFYSDHHTVGL
jgi:hypothetical protein